MRNEAIKVHINFQVESTPFRLEQINDTMSANTHATLDMHVTSTYFASNTSHNMRNVTSKVCACNIHV